MQRFICERQGKGRSKNAKWGRYESLSLHNEESFSCVEEEDFPVERLHLAFSVLNKLSPTDRRIFLLRYQDEKTVQEIGREVGLHFGTVSRRLQATHKWINSYLMEKECS
jgi:RNA polymerase sigma factor (sigma-70 family)